MSTPFVMDDYPASQIPDVPLWSENFGHMFADPNIPLSVFCHFGRWYADPTLWREMVIAALPDGTILFAKNYGRNAPAKGPGASLAALEVVQPAQELRLRFSGPVWKGTHADMIRGIREGRTYPLQLDLRFNATAPVWSMKGHTSEALTIAGSMHTEQIGRANGFVEFDSVRHVLNDGYAVRDHSRGVREPSNYKQHYWFNGCFGSHLAFHIYAMEERVPKTDHGMAMAVMIIDGKIEPATIVSHAGYSELTTPASKLPNVTLRCASGDYEIRTRRVMNTFPASFVTPYDMFPGGIVHDSHALFVEEFVELECRGERGFGWSDRGQLQHAK